MKLYLALGNRALAALATVALLAFVPPARANLVRNGNFTGTTLSSPGGHICDDTVTGSVCVSTVNDWSATCSSFGCGFTSSPASLLFNGTGGSAWNVFFGTTTPVGDLSNYNGNYIGGDGDPLFRSNFFQTISGLTPGQNYALTFFQASAQQFIFTSPFTVQWVVSLGSQTQDSALITNSGGLFTPWNQQTMIFTADNASEVLNFLAVSPEGEPPIALLADVSLGAETPEPAYLTLLGVGLAVLLTCRLRGMRRA